MTQMTDISYPAPAELQEVTEAQDDPTFYVVSRRKFAILFVATFGLYGLYWFYRNWDLYRDHREPMLAMAEGNIWPFPRAWFFLFFIHSLFRKVKALGEEKPQVAKWSNNWHASLLVVLYLATNFFSRFDTKSNLVMLALIGFVLQLFTLLRAQTMINISCDDPKGASNDKLTWANWGWILPGALYLILQIVAGFSAGVSQGYAPSSSSF